MNAEVTVIEGEAVEIPTERAVIVAQPGQSLVASEGDPGGMIAVASRLATELKKIVEAQRLYAVISGKKYPQVEAWMTIARLDNVVAREPQPPIRHDDGSYEAFAELIRLSDGMVIGSSSALCGTPDDKPWGGRAEPARRSMAQTRATSRAFRQQYSWIMALAGYEPTPAEEMPATTSGHPSSPAAPSAPAAAPLGGGGTFTLTGKATKGNGNGMDLLMRQTPDGNAIGFKLMELTGHPDGKKSTGVRAFGALAVAVAAHADEMVGQEITVVGTLKPESLDIGGTTRNYTVLIAEYVEGPGFAVPASSDDSTHAAAPEPSTEPVEDLSELPW